MLSLVLILIFSFFLWLSIESFSDLDLKNFNIGSIIGLVGSLFFISLLVERLIEVVFQDKEAYQKRKLERHVDLLKDDMVIVVNKEDKILQSNTILSNKIIATDDEESKLQKIALKKEEIEDTLSKLKLSRRSKVAPITFTMGLLISLAGIRIINDLIVVPPTSEIQHYFINVIDMILTGSIISGGSGGIHSIIKIVNSFSLD